jgi:hypothetical protein
LAAVQVSAQVRYSSDPRGLAGEVMDLDGADAQFAQLAGGQAAQRAQGRPVSAAGAPATQVLRHDFLLLPVGANPVRIAFVDIGSLTEERCRRFASTASNRFTKAETGFVAAGSTKH